MKTSLVIAPISVEEMLNRPEQEYNPQIWKEKVKRFSTYDKCQFYVIEPDEHYSYARFYASYVGDGIYFFSEFNAFHSCLSNNGFCKVQVLPNGEVHKFLFSDSTGKEGYAENCKANRQTWKDYYTPRNIMISNCI